MTPIQHASVPPSPSICFVAPDAFGVLSGAGDLQRIGGAEVQQAHIARGLVQRGIGVRFVTLDHGQPDALDCNGIRVFKACRWDAGLPGLRFFHPRWSRLVAALRRADADIYYQRAAGAETGQIALWCRMAGRPFVFAVALDDDCLRSLPHLRDWRERRLYRYGLRSAAAVVAQTQRQLDTLQSEFGVRARLIQSCAADPFADRSWRPPSRSDFRVLWVGRFARQKRPHLLAEVAARAAELNFVAVGAANDRSDYARDCQARLAALPNVELAGWAPHARMHEYFSQSAALLCTSASEGFPNIFLEAWSHGVPVVSTVDPDRAIELNGLGSVADAPEALAAALRRLAQDPDLWQSCGERARKHFETRHAIDAVAQRYVALIDELARQRRTPRARGA